VITCTKCSIAQPPEEFYASRTTGKRRRQCRTCVKAYVTAWQQRNRDRHSVYVRKTKLRAEYGLTLDQHAALFAAQNGLCAICGSEPHETQGLAVDHCHQTGDVRGLLCHKCNRGIGYFKDSPERLRAAAEYLSTPL
jgi:hypothetical protein